MTPSASGFSSQNFSSQRPNSKPGRFHGSQPIEFPKIFLVISLELLDAAIAIIESA